jgi:hypothetical protein
MPSRLHISTNENTVNTNGKNFIPSLPMVWRTMLAMNSYHSSPIDWMRLGTSWAEREAAYRIAVTVPAAATMNSDELVKLKSMPPTLNISTMGLIWNWLSGSLATIFSLLRLAARLTARHSVSRPALGTLPAVRAMFRMPAAKPASSRVINPKGKVPSSRSTR